MLAMVERVLPIHRNVILFVSLGLIGSFTTFSTFSVESLQLICSNQIVLALISVTANTSLGIGAVWLGRFLGLKF
jgi:CrcB protein